MSSINFVPLYDFADKHRVSYNELCAVVRAALAEQPAAPWMSAQKPLEEPYRSILADNAEKLYIREEQPAAPVEFARICDSLPEGVNWGDPLTPAMARHIFESAIPPGHVVVPVEPTEEMVDAADREGATSARKLYAAMIAARPGEKE